MYTLLAAITGGFVALMIQLNGDLQLREGALPALLAIHLSGVLAAFGYLAVARRGNPKRASKLPLVRGSAPFWFVSAGAFGAVVVFLSSEIYARGGVLLTLSGTLAGTTLLAHLLEGTKWFDGRRSPPLQRLISLALILPGSLLIGLRSGAGILWILLSWVPGIVLMAQSMMNSRNALRYGQPQMVALNYLSALAVLIPVAALGGVLTDRAAAKLLSAPPALLLGGGLLGVIVVALSTMLFNRTSALRVVLGVYTGQLAVGVLLDLMSGVPVEGEKILGIVLVVLGLASEQLHRLWRAGNRQP